MEKTIPNVNELSNYANVCSIECTNNFEILNSLCVNCNEIAHFCACSYNVVTSLGASNDFINMKLNENSNVPQCNQSNLNLYTFTVHKDVSCIENCNDTDQSNKFNEDISHHTEHQDTVTSKNSNVSELPKDNFSSLGFIKKGLRVGNLNIRHLFPKIDQLKLLLEGRQSPDIFGICETFLSESVPNDLLNINGFSFERRDRGREGGGILVYIANSISYKRRTDLETNSTESIWIQVNIPNSKPILFCSVYRPPNSLTSWIDHFEFELDQASQNFENEIIIAGDLNIDFLKAIPTKWKCLMSLYHFEQKILHATRVTADSETLIDHIYTNRPENIIESVVPVCAMSDHYPVCVTRHTPEVDKKNKHIENSYRNF